MPEDKRYNIISIKISRLRGKNLLNIFQKKRRKERRKEGRKGKEKKSFFNKRYTLNG